MIGTGEHNLAVLLERAAQRAGADHPSLWFEGTWHTTGQLHERARRLGAGLAGVGVEPGDRVMVVMANTPDVGPLYQAIWRAGAVATPAIFLLPPRELRHILTDSGADHVVTTPDLLEGVRQAAEGTGVRIVCPGGPGDTLDLDELAAAEPGAIVDRGDDDLAALLYTGGTTGRAKGVTFTHDNLWHAGRAGYRATADATSLHRTLVPLPLSHAFGLTVSVTGAHDPEPGDSLLMRWFDPAGFVDLVEQHGVEQATVVPTMLSLLLEEPLEDRDLSSLRRLICGSAPLPTEVLEEFERRVPSAEILEGWGLTESCANGTLNRPGRRKPGTVGPPLPGTDLRIVDEDGNDLPAGEHGEVLIRSPAVSGGYWRDPEETAAAFRDGWLHTGDVGSLDGDGFLTIHDRKKDVIIRSGFNVYPRDVEDVLHEHGAVAAAGVVGRPDDTHGEEIVAFVQPLAGAEPDPDDLREWARERLGPKSYPREVRLISQVPRTPVMKTDRRALRERL